METINHKRKLEATRKSQDLFQKKKRKVVQYRVAKIPSGDFVTE